MAIEDNGPESAYQGPAASAPDTEDGLYPEADGDLGHKQGGDTEPLPGSNEPHPSGVDAAESEPEPKQGTDHEDMLSDDDNGNPDAKLDSTIDEE